MEVVAKNRKRIRNGVNLRDGGVGSTSNGRDPSNSGRRGRGRFIDRPREACLDNITRDTRVGVLLSELLKLIVQVDRWVDDL